MTNPIRNHQLNHPMLPTIRSLDINRQVVICHHNPDIHYHLLSRRRNLDISRNSIHRNLGIPPFPIQITRRQEGILALHIHHISEMNTRTNLAAA